MLRRLFFQEKKTSKLKELQKFLEVVGRANPKYGPHHPRRPDTMLRRVIRGMLPMDKEKGKRAFKSLKVNINIPSDIAGKEFQTIDEASALKLRCSYVTLGVLTKEIGCRK
ncbi:MAG: uL13 family ribosomal protein [Candidatus Bathyarchaeota archaeon]